jgi:hypothetical protein
MRNAYKILVGKPERRIELGRHVLRRENKTTMDIREAECLGVY